MDTQTKNIRMLRFTDIQERTQLSRSCLHNLTAEGVFPPLIHLSDRARGQFEHVVDAWLQTRMDARADMSRLRDAVTLPLWDPEMESCEHPSGIQMMHMAKVGEMVGMKSSQIYRLIKVGRFPGPVPVTKGARRWAWHEVEEWLQSRIALSLKIAGVRDVSGSSRRYPRAA